ncbi:hypothetical protein [Prosthecobacter sp.]|uniref:hypothetical protein n=1 Tax=Prosthecobacter sp. TaxID=1965333 RepID=UPI002487CEF7|nr:hypothetical protein [Prosthecobacter sp.]MDI1313114.1 hypothetical protein [Prosthecobacter sp.]
MSISRLPVLLVSASLGLILSLQPSVANEAYFSKDGKTVTMGLGGRGRTGLVQVDVATGKITPAPLPAELKDESIDSVAAGSEGEALFLAKDGVWVWTPGAATPVKHVCATAPVVGATDLFVSTVPGTPLTDCLLISGNESADATSRGTFYGRKPSGKHAFLSVFCRRVSDATGGIFSTDGRLFFVTQGDVWEGGIQMDEEAGTERLGTLVGARIAPLGIMNTDEANGGNMWVQHVAPAGKWIYAQLRGRHMAAIMRVPLPAKALHSPTSDDTLTTQDQLDAMTYSLNKTEIISEDMEFAAGFCATEVGGKPRVFYFGDAEEDKGLAMMLWEGAGKPRVIGHLPQE